LPCLSRLARTKLPSCEWVARIQRQKQLIIVVEFKLSFTPEERNGRKYDNYLEFFRIEGGISTGTAAGQGVLYV
jgi:hypothetical protein